jgi:hypothetical protein
LDLVLPYEDFFKETVSRYFRSTVFSSI